MAVAEGAAPAAADRRGRIADEDDLVGLDGLVLVDLTRAERSVLQRYMGNEGLEIFLHHHRSMVA